MKRLGLGASKSRSSNFKFKLLARGRPITRHAAALRPFSSLKERRRRFDTKIRRMMLPAGARASSPGLATPPSEGAPALRKAQRAGTRATPPRRSRPRPGSFELYVAWSD